MKRVLFLCSRNRLRSPTAERILAGWPGIETASAGLAPDADEPLTAEALDGVGLVLVMERVTPHLDRLTRSARRQHEARRITGPPRQDSSRPRLEPS